MDKKRTNEYYTIDVVHILRSIWHKAWIVVLASVLAAGIGFGLSSYVMQPDYASSILLYVNNGAINIGSTSVSLGDLTASQSLVKTYTELLKNRTTLEMVAQEAGVEYTYKELFDMIEAGSSNGTEVMKVTVTAKDPFVASKIANTISEILPERINAIIDGATMEVVDLAIPHTQKVGPSITKYTALFMIGGALLAALIIAVLAMLDDTIHDEEYVLQNYDYPILAKIPNLSEHTSRSRGYYYYYYRKHDKQDKQ